MGKNSKRGVMFLFVLLLFGSLIFWPTSTASAEELYVEELEIFTEDLELDTSDLPDNEELFAGYVDKMFYGTESSTFGSAGRERLNANEKFLYDYLKDCINKVADGNLASSKFTIDQETLLAWNGKGFKLFWNAEELGVDTLYTVSGNTLTVTEEAKTAFKNICFSKLDTDAVFYALLFDCPYDLYWYDKTDTGFSGSYSYNIHKDENNEYTLMGFTSLYFNFGVVKAYQGVDEYSADTAKTSVASIAVTNANEFIESAEISSLGDYDKLNAYKNKIMELVSYNNDYEAYKSENGYGDPWQLIWVFDENPETNVVCEGYAKAFQYLCDMSEFENDSIACYTVTGTAGGGHMWNVVTMEDGNNYIVDVTNSESNTVGKNGELFLGGTTGSIEDGYTFEFTGQNVQFIYDEDTIDLYGDDYSSILNLAEISYDEVIQPEPSLKFTSVSLGLSDSLSLRFKLNSDAVNYYNEVRVKFNFNGEETTVVVDKETATVEFTDIGPDQMTETITATILGDIYIDYADQYEEREGETLTYSAAEYCYTTLANSSSSSKAKLRTLLVDLLNYGAAAQEYTGTNLDNLANAELTTTQEGWGTQETPEYNNTGSITKNMTDEPANWISAKLILKDTISIYFKFEATGVENLKVKVNGSNVASKNIVSAGEENTYYVIYEGIKANQMSKNLSLVIYDGDTQVSETLTYSVEAYASHMSDAEMEDFQNLVTAMMKYGNSADAYAN